MIRHPFFLRRQLHVIAEVCGEHQIIFFRDLEHSPFKLHLDLVLKAFQRHHLLHAVKTGICETPCCVRTGILTEQPPVLPCQLACGDNVERVKRPVYKYADIFSYRRQERTATAVCIRKTRKFVFD